MKMLKIGLKPILLLKPSVVYKIEDTSITNINSTSILPQETLSQNTILEEPSIRSRSLESRVRPDHNYCRQITKYKELDNISVESEAASTVSIASASAATEAINECTPPLEVPPSQSQLSKKRRYQNEWSEHNYHEQASKIRKTAIANGKTEMLGPSVTNIASTPTKPSSSQCILEEPSVDAQLAKKMPLENAETPECNSHKPPTEVNKEVSRPKIDVETEAFSICIADIISSPTEEGINPCKPLEEPCLQAKTTRRCYENEWSEHSYHEKATDSNQEISRINTEMNHHPHNTTYPWLLREAAVQVNIISKTSIKDKNDKLRQKSLEIYRSKRRIKKLCNKIKSMKSRLKELRYLENILNNARKGDTKALMLSEQCKAYGKKRHKWPKEVLKNTMMCYCRSPQAYRYLRKYYINLPSRTSIKKFIADAEGDVAKDIMAIVGDIVNTVNLEASENDIMELIGDVNAVNGDTNRNDTVTLNGAIVNTVNVSEDEAAIMALIGGNVNTVNGDANENCINGENPDFESL